MSVFLPVSIWLIIQKYSTNLLATSPTEARTCKAYTMLLSPLTYPLQPRSRSRHCAFPRKRTFVALASTNSSHSSITKAVMLRGHGKNGWIDAGWDWQQNTLSEDLQDLLITYGQLAQITYDKLGQNCCQEHYGYAAVDNPRKPDLLEGLTTYYPLKMGAQPKANARGVCDKYKLPSDDKLNPVIHAVPGKLQNNSVANVKNQRSLNPLEWAWFAKVYDSVTSALAGFVDSGSGGHALFREPGPDGRGKKERGAFMGYVAVLEPDPSDIAQGVDVALVWRGTIFREEWENNFAQNKLDKWVKDERAGDPDDPADARAMHLGDPKDLEARRAVAPEPWMVGVHDGFEDLYNRPTSQWPSEKHSRDTYRSPRQVVHSWLKKLMKEQNVTTITTTGHSLGGALCTLCAYDVLEWLDATWDSDKVDRSGWATKEKPRVTCMSWAAPRVGNARFHMEFNRLGGRCLRVVNKGDVVPLVPGLVATLVLSFLERLPIVGRRSVMDTDFALLAFIRTASYYLDCLLAVLFKYHNPWAFWHLGQMLELDIARAPKGVLKGSTVEKTEPIVDDKQPGTEKEKKAKEAEGPNLGQKHNLELYLYLVSLLGPEGWKSDTDRNYLFLNKSDDVLDDKHIPAVWWSREKRYGFEREAKGNWVFKGMRNGAKIKEKSFVA